VFVRACLRARAGKLVFVDLAGSERLKRTKGEHAEETGAINRSLFTLAKVISLLADHNDSVAAQGGGGKGGALPPHIP